MRLFLDTSVLLTAAGSSTGASRFIVQRAFAKKWQLVSSRYCQAEVRRNLPKMGESAALAFAKEIEPELAWCDDTYASGQLLVFPVAKDRPVVWTAIAQRCDVLLTLDRNDFHKLLGNQVYGVLIRTPGDWLEEVLAPR